MILCRAGNMVQPLNKPKIVKKHTKKFKRHQHDRKIAVKVSLEIKLTVVVFFTRKQALSP